MHHSNTNVVYLQGLNDDAVGLETAAWSAGTGLGNGFVVGPRTGNVDAAVSGTMWIGIVGGTRTVAGGRGAGPVIVAIGKRIAVIRNVTVGRGRNGSLISGRERLRSKRSPLMVSCNLEEENDLMAIRAARKGIHDSPPGSFIRELPLSCS